jgi:hypothetical protein
MKIINQITMKRILSISMLLMATLIAFGQQTPNNEIIDNSGAREVNDFTCDPGAVFSQQPPTWDVAAYGDASSLFTKCAEDYIATDPFNCMTFWAINAVYPTETFLIEFFDGDPRNPATILVHSFNVSADAINTGYIFGSSQDIYEFNISFGTDVSLLNGWVSISRTTVPVTIDFAWLGENGSGNCIQFDSGQGIWLQNDNTNLFCLWNYQEIPIANWALFIGIGLIITFTIIRYRRLT